MYTMEVLISQQDIQERVRDLGARISNDYQGRQPIIVGILNGAVFFFADLVRNITIPVKMDFVRARSYGSAMESCGKVDITKDIELPVKDSPVILVEDIVDSGLTVAAVVEHVMKMGASSCSICALIDKKERRQCDVEIDYTAFTMETGFLVGYGLDYDEKYRYLRDIYVLKSGE
jgi:hypoxanthine phosphoribosyltransferase